jgi:hypothetical protein
LQSAPESGYIVNAPIDEIDISSYLVQVFDVTGREVINYSNAQTRLNQCPRDV